MKNKNRDRNRPCWCGSGVKYKKCHLHYSCLPRKSFGEISALRNRKINEPVGCYYPGGHCDGRPIESHTLQRSGSLKTIAENGHVYRVGVNFDGKPPQLGVNPIGVKKASTFYGFCSTHDSMLFAPAEQKEFIGTSEQCFLLAYRSLVYELHAKRVNLFDGKLLDLCVQGRGYSEQERTYIWYQDFNHSMAIAINEMEEEKKSADQYLADKNYSNYCHCIVHFDSIPTMVCSGGFNPEYSFSGERLLDLTDLTVRAQKILFNLICAGDKGMGIFSWDPEYSAVASRFVSALIDVDSDKLAGVIAACAFDWLENLFVKPTWWDGLEDKVKKYYESRGRKNLPFELVSDPGKVIHGCPDVPFSVSSVELVNWQIA